MVQSKHKTAAAKVDKDNPFALMPDAQEDSNVHIIRPGIRCDTERRGFPMRRGRSPLEIVVDASEGFVPLWGPSTTLRWRFQERSFQVLRDPAAAKQAVTQLIAEAILLWGDAAPVKFAYRDDAWDFEVVMRNADDCTNSGCVLASAFFPDAGQHQMTIYPQMFTQNHTEQVETMAHEIGHVFGLRHFFAVLNETAWPAEIFGTHDKFSIMNYGDASRMTDADRADLRKLYERAWAGTLTEINGTSIKFMRPFHTSGQAADVAVAIAAVTK
ncbi:matrixin family metalloprotease [Rhizobium ruizarguesonis]|uniref:matrixin family metalloprotease n=1 Tax=Rhizobium ruizarguesonis TaxID=2081791 RepID=UPI0010302B79|nr:matrixin family metalloprotease [Rhizobium ruizarguesonis]TAZ68239.1 matrixin family metalloprotease [Rhizobium ruizarguesonis]TAZ92269.1 matrixin family metalloprotease [Rhizobium ruizarguesonis]TBD71735.1 matrixin family metalloprotease [Rhizobium ruizarguesonis]TBD94892.1 matrixin family metalloprotease [Rhizobium ruizarguesonis]TBE14550.1 matrixin family metalloprotease [Rhizobium ruizarguesonis]